MLCGYYIININTYTQVRLSVCLKLLYIWSVHGTRNVRNWLGYGLCKRFFHPKSVHPGLETHQASYFVGIQTFSPELKEPGRKADHSPTCSADVMKEEDLWICLPHVSSWCGDGQFYFLCLFLFYLILRAGWLSLKLQCVFHLLTTAHCVPHLSPTYFKKK